jgi:hypothetical protein
MSARAIPVPFVLFPEGTIPAATPAGLDCLQRQMQQADSEVIFVGVSKG